MSTNARTIPSAAPKSVSTFTILSNGKPIPRSMHVLSIVVSKEVNRIPWATVLLQDGEASSETFDVSNQPEFEPGVELEIHTGYRSQEEPVFKGIVIRHGIKVRKNASVLVVEAKDAAVKMTTQLRNRYFAELADSDLIEQLLADYGLESDVEATSITHHELVQANVSDWDFMLCRADVSGLFVIAHDGRVEVKKPDLAQEAVLTAQFGGKNSTRRSTRATSTAEWSLRHGVRRIRRSRPTLKPRILLCRRPAISPRRRWLPSRVRIHGLCVTAAEFLNPNSKRGPMLNWSNNG
jgi:phage protein D